MKLIFLNDRLHCILGILGLVLVFFGSVTSSPFPPTNLVTFSDKLIHAFAYGLLSFWFVQLVEPKRYFYLGAALFCYGALIECVQGQLPHRSTSGLDMLANFTGIVLAIGIWTALVKALPKGAKQ